MSSEVDVPKALDEIIKQQRILFYGFMRLRVLKHLNKKQYELIPIDVIKLCIKFYEINIESCFDQFDEQKKLSSLIKLSFMFIDSEQYFIAKNTLQILLSLSPSNDSNHLIYRYQGEVLIRLNLFDEAEESFRLVAEKTGDKCEYIYGKALFKHKKYELAIVQFKKAIQLNNDDVKSIAECAECYKELNDFVNAEKYYQKAADAAPTDVEYRRNYAAFLYTQGYRIDASLQFMKVREIIEEKESKG